MDRSQYQDKLTEQVAKKEWRKLKARQQDRSVWFGLGMFGLVGWSIATPILIGIAVGIWLDQIWPHEFSCTLICLFIGVVTGCSIAWYWVKRESLLEMDAEKGESSNELDNEPQGHQE